MGRIRGKVVTIVTEQRMNIEVFGKMFSLIKTIVA